MDDRIGVYLSESASICPNRRLFVRIGVLFLIDSVAAITHHREQDEKYIQPPSPLQSEARTEGLGTKKKKSRLWRFRSMTVTNAAATVARNSETDTKSSTLDLGLDSIVLLKRQGKSSVKNIVSPSSFRGWLESSPSDGERWLRSRAQDGDLYAMEKLGLRLLTGYGLPKSLDEGLEWLKRSAGLGNPFAMEKLAENELDENQSPESSAKGERWLRNAVERGHRLAMVNLGTRLITGNGLARDPENGERFLREVAQRGSQIAIVRLGTYLLFGWGLNLDTGEV